MLRLRTLRFGLGVWACSVAVGAGPEDGPDLEEPIVSTRAFELLQDDGRPAPPPVSGPRHEAFQGDTPGPIRVDEAPPSPIAERPAGNPPSPDAGWIGGYWTWVPDGGFLWVPGTWAVPPPGRFWVDGQWRRDEQGWSRVAGFWSGGQAGRGDWRTDGPPADRPEEEVGPAPGPDRFYLASHYVPDGDDVAWKPGFWAKSQPGWDWSPARWVRLADGWTFHEGHWERSPTDPDARLASSTVTATSGRIKAMDQPSTVASTPTESVDPYVVQRPVFAEMPTLSPLVPLADQLARESDAFVGSIAANGRILVDSGSFIAEGRRVRDAALRLRQAVGNGASPGQVSWELQNLQASWQLLYNHVYRVTGARPGPFVGLALRMGSTTAQILQFGR